MTNTPEDAAELGRLKVLREGVLNILERTQRELAELDAEITKLRTPVVSKEASMMLPMREKPQKDEGP